MTDIKTAAPEQVRTQQKNIPSSFFHKHHFFPLATIIVRDLYFVLSGVSLGPSSVQSIHHFTSYLCQHLSAFIVPAASGN